MCYWIYVNDNKGYTSLSINSSNFNNINDSVFQADFYSGYQIINFVALPNRWRSTKTNYNYVKNGHMLHILVIKQL